MARQVDLFMPPKGQFGVLSHFTKKIHEAFERNGIKSRLLTAEKSNPKPFIDQIFLDKPDFTLSFNGLLPDEENRFLCDLINIPHLAYVVDSPNVFVQLSRSPLTIVGNTDKMGCQFFKSLGCKNVLFLPHAIEKDLTPPNVSQERPYDAVFLGSCIDFEKILEGWKRNYPSYLSETLELAAHMVTTNLGISFPEALVNAMNEKIWFAGVDVSKFDFVELLEELEYYVRGKDRVGLLQSISSVKVDVFTPKEQLKDWKKLLGPGHENIVFHDPVNYDQALEIMKKSKLVLNSTPSIKNGGHERIFAGLACETSVITNQSIFLLEQFGAGSGVLFYDLTDPEKLNEDIRKLIANPDDSIAAAKKGREIVMNHHTWDHRVRQILNEVTPILESIKT